VICMTYSPAPSFPLIATLGVINRWAILRGYFRVQAIDLPAPDEARLKRAVNRGTAAFVAPNHPEFGLDWMIDKELSRRVAPRMAFWASHTILAAAPWFWSRNNLVSNKGGADSFEYSVRWALAGHGVLLHPEGMVHWTSDTVHPLYKGIAAMALETARRGTPRPVYIVPVIWKLRYTRDVSAGMHADMGLIERELGVVSGRGSSVVERFGRLIDALGDEAARERYPRETLTQEHIHESLKRIRADRVRRTRAHVLHNFLPTPYGPRVAHVRVPEPIRVTPDQSVEELLAATRTTMQTALDGLNREIAPAVDPFRHPNPFAAGSAGADRRQTDSRSRSLCNPAAVTLAPAPGPVMTNGRPEYRSVVNEN
jgi:hypothetical protein